MSKYDFIIDGIRFSYSSTSSFSNCKYGFKLAYIDAANRKKNFFSDYGLLVHDCFEQFFMKKLKAEELAEYYKEEFYKQVTSSPPPYPQGMMGRYYAQGLSFFKDFDFPIDEYDVLVVEDTIDFELESGATFTARPDLVLKHKETGITALWDYKTSTPFRIDKRSGKEIEDKQKMLGYYKQMHIYAYALREISGYDISEISLWFPRLNKIVTIPWVKETENEVFEWLNMTIKDIKKEEDFPPDPSQKYFCQNLCGVRDSCQYWG